MSATSVFHFRGVPVAQGLRFGWLGRPGKGTGLMSFELSRPSRARKIATFSRGRRRQPDRRDSHGLPSRSRLATTDSSHFVPLSDCGRRDWDDGPGDSSGGSFTSNVPRCIMRSRILQGDLSGYLIATGMDHAGRGTCGSIHQRRRFSETKETPIHMLGIGYDVGPSAALDQR
jgi:hypothetical protein